MKKNILVLALLMSQLGIAQATAVISNVSYTATSITFTATGDLSGYALPPIDNSPRVISIVYTGNLAAAIGASNTYSGELFTNSLALMGYTLKVSNEPAPHTWTIFSGSDLRPDTFSGNPFTISFNKPVLNTTGTGEIQFIWGGPVSGTPIQSIQVTDGSLAAVPEPETYAMLLAGLGLIGAVRRRKLS